LSTSAGQVRVRAKSPTSSATWKVGGCILFDDIVNSAGTLCNAAKSLMDAGAVEVSAYVTHGVLSGSRP